MARCLQGLYQTCHGDEEAILQAGGHILEEMLDVSCPRTSGCKPSYSIVLTNTPPSGLSTWLNSPFSPILQYHYRVLHTVLGFDVLGETKDTFVSFVSPNTSKPSTVSTAWFCTHPHARNIALTYRLHLVLKHHCPLHLLLAVEECVSPW